MSVVNSLLLTHESVTVFNLLYLFNAYCILNDVYMLSVDPAFTLLGVFFLMYWIFLNQPNL